MFLARITKSAFATYNYGGATARNYTPDKPSYPKVIHQDSGEISKPVTPSVRNIPQQPKSGKNKPAGKWYSEFEFLHSFAPTISGTGSGHQYWQDKRNPYEV